VVSHRQFPPCRTMADLTPVFVLELIDRARLTIFRGSGRNMPNGRAASRRILSVEEAINFEVVINLKPAKALGPTIPPSLLLRADEEIR
jgi:hypothetical protein